MDKIRMRNPIAELDGDEMTRVLWRMIKDTLLLPFVELNTEYYDLSLPHRDETADRVTHEAAEAIRRLHVGVKCATITPNQKRMEEYHLHEMWKSPNGTIRAALDGTVFRTPIVCSRIEPHVRGWKKPITVARHAYGDLYRASEYRVPGPGTATLSFEGDGGERWSETVFRFEGGGVISAQHNRDDSIRSFARSCFAYALGQKQDLWFSAKDTIAKQYDGAFRDIFREVYETEYRAAFAEAGLTYFYTLIDDAVARAMRSEGGFVWALKNYDGDVMSDMISAAFGSLAMMTSVLVSPDGNYEYEAAHGTITRHYYRWQKGETTSSNPVATIFAWSGALRKRGELDGNGALCAFADTLERAVLETIDDGVMTGDLAALCGCAGADTQTFLDAVRNRLTAALASV